MRKKPIERLHFITLDNYHTPAAQQVSAACKAGIKWVQLRMKQAKKDAIFETAKEVRSICSRHDVRLIINDHLDIALECSADGVHLGRQDMPVDKARALAGNRLIIGGTANTPFEAVKMAELGADYIGAGPFRFTATKKNLSPVLGKLGIKAILEELYRRGITLPVVAVGGITAKDISDLLTLPLHGVAVSGLIARASQPGQLIQKIEDHINRSTAYVDNRQ